MSKYIQDKIKYRILQNSKKNNQCNDYNVNNEKNDLLKIIKKYELTIFNNESKNIALMLESRYLTNTEIVIRQFSRFLPNDFAMYIYVTKNVYNQYEQLAKRLNNNIMIHLLPDKYKLDSAVDYNNIMLDILFWKLFINFNRVLIFQLDTIIYKNNISDFYDYDYIGAPWNPENMISNNVGNGGLSLRNIHAMIYCLENKDDVIITKYKTYEDNLKIFKNIHPEDVFYSYAMNQFNYKIADVSVAKMFAIEVFVSNEDCMGSHKLNVYNPDLYNKLLYKSIFVNNKNNVIPLNIYQTWHTKELPYNMKLCSESIRKNNPEFNYQLYDDNECREFIKNNFDDKVLWAFDQLIPGAYKADLWRYCILYEKGGIYVDIKYSCINEFKFITLVDKEYFVIDRIQGWYKDQKSIYTGVLICKPKNELLLLAINEIVKNTANNFYGLNSLHPTGPILIGILYEKKINIIQKNDFELIYTHDGSIIEYNTIPILQIYQEYRNDLNIYQKNKHYGELWTNKNIYQNYPPVKKKEESIIMNTINIADKPLWEKTLFVYQYLTKNNNDFIEFIKKYKISDITNINKIRKIENTDLQLSDNMNELKDLLLNNKLITTRMGCIESKFILQYKFNYIINDHHDTTNGIDYHMKKNTGLYYKDDNRKKEIFDWWINNTIEIIQNSTLTSCFSVIHYDLKLWAHLNIKNKFYNWTYLHKILLKNMENKKLLYIGSATKSIKYSYNNDVQKKWHFKIPKFGMYFVDTPQTILGMPYPDESIIETTDIIVDKIIKKYYDFDVAILECGAYGPPIMNKLNTILKNKNIIYMGSSCYTMFGIYSHSMPIPEDKDAIKDNWTEVLEKYDKKCKDIDQSKY